MSSSSVVVYAYDLTQGMGKVYGPMFIGKPVEAVYHTSVVVYGLEYFFGGGIQSATPKTTPFGHPLQEIPYGNTELPKEDFEQFLSSVQGKYNENNYDLIKNNCNHFTSACLEILVGQPLQKDILDQAEELLNTPMGQMFKPFIDQMRNKPVTSNQQIPNIAQQQGLNLAGMGGLGGFANIGVQQQQQQQQVHDEGNVKEVHDIEEFMLEMSHGQVVFDFFADWCGPCKNIKPYFAQLSKQYQNVRFRSINIDKNQDTAQNLGVQSIPTFIFYKDGNQVATIKGANQQQLKSNLDTHFS